MHAADTGLRPDTALSEPVNEPKACRLDDVGVKHGTWLSSLGRDCLATWEPFLAPWRDQHFDLLEIGVGTGASLRTWREWFPRARLAGIDARRIVLDPPISDCTLTQGDQTDLLAFQSLLRDYRFRVIVADGSLHDDDQIRAFMTLFPWLEPGSLYFCAGFEERSQAEAEGPGWFAELGAALGSASMRDELLREQPALDPVFRRLRGVFLTRSSVVATS